MFTKEQLRDAFLSGVVSGRLSKSNLKIIHQSDLEAESEQVEKEYGPYWPGELLMAGYFDYDEKVGALEHAGWLRKQRAARVVARALSFKMERNEATGQATTIVEFRCPNCKQLHTQCEIYSGIPANFSVVTYSLECGYVRVAMPWAAEAARQ